MIDSDAEEASLDGPPSLVSPAHVVPQRVEDACLLHVDERQFQPVQTFFLEEIGNLSQCAHGRVYIARLVGILLVVVVLVVSREFFPKPRHHDPSLFGGGRAACGTGAMKSLVFKACVSLGAVEIHGLLEVADRNLLPLGDVADGV